MTSTKPIDLGHLMFLGLARSLVKACGPATAKGMLLRNAIEAGEQMEPADYPNFDDFVCATTEGMTPLARFEGRAVHLGSGVFGLPACPFAPVLVAYREVFQAPTGGFDELVAEFNKSSAATDRIRVGEGAGVSAFCTLHQPIRSVVGGRITVGGAPLKVYQLACKSAGGARGYADKWIHEGRFDRALVERAMDEHMCCYGILAGEPAPRP